MVVKNILITAETGMHSRPATILVTEADKFKSNIILSFHDKEIDFKSIIGVLSLGIYMGEVITLTFEGEDEVQASIKIVSLIEELYVGKEVKNDWF